MADDTPNRSDARYVPLFASILTGMFANPAYANPITAIVRDALEAADQAFAKLPTLTGGTGLTK